MPPPKIHVTKEMARAGAEILSSYYDTRCDDVTQELAADVFREMTGVRDRNLTITPSPLAQDVIQLKTDTERGKFALLLGHVQTEFNRLTRERNKLTRALESLSSLPPVT